MQMECCWCLSISKNIFSTTSCHMMRCYRSTYNLNVLGITFLQMMEKLKFFADHILLLTNQLDSIQYITILLLIIPIIYSTLNNFMQSTDFDLFLLTSINFNSLQWNTWRIISFSIINVWWKSKRDYHQSASKSLLFVIWTILFL